MGSAEGSLEISQVPAVRRQHPSLVDLPHSRPQVVLNTVEFHLFWSEPMVCVNCP